jgi:UDP:flavonoid glycosyltransferase YjiC (YdhE family)
LRITIAALGTRGDVQPLIALGQGLRSAGHDVTMIAGSNFAGWVARHELRFVPSVDIEALMASEKGVAWSHSSDNPVKQVRMMRGLMNEYGQGMIDPIQTCAASAGLLISGFSAQSIVQTASEKSGVPCLNALLQPQYATRSGAASLTPVFPNRESIANRWLGTLAERIIWSVAAETTNRYRSQLGLPPHNSTTFRRANYRTPAVMGFSRHVVPPAPDWPKDAALTGYWFLDEETGWSPPKELTAFLAAGPPPVYIGFGSMSHRDPQKTLDLIVAAVKRSGQRAVVAAGWAGLPAGSHAPEVCVVKSAPHHWLFPQVSAVVHHGGAGTTAAGLRAGRPTLIIPHLGDQPYWGRRVYQLGAGVKPLPRHKLTLQTLASRLDQLTRDTRIRDAAAALGEKIRAERGVDAAVATIDRLLR